MAARGAKPGSGKKSRKQASGKAKAAGVASVLGNDPFERGAAVRAPALHAPVPPDPSVATAAELASAPAAEPAPAPAAAPAPAPASPAAEPPAVAVETFAPRAEASETGAPVLDAPVRDGSSPAPTPGAVVAPSPVAPPVPRSAVEEVRARLGAVEARVESFAAAAATRLGELAREDAAGEQARDLMRAVRQLLPGLRDRLTALAGLGSLFLSAGELDAHGLDRDLAEGIGPFIDFLYGTWWRVDARDVERVPATGPAIVVANHGGVLPWDALVLRTALRRDHPARRELRPLLDEHALARRLAGTLARRLGAVAATPEHAAQLLEQGTVVAVFPEGSRGSTRPWSERYRIQRFGRGGFARLALRLGVPIVPCAIVGSEETALPMARAGWLSSALGMPFLTSPPPLPFVPLGAVPLPARWSLRFGAPIDTAGDGPDAAADQARVLDLTERVRSSLQGMLDEDVAARRSVYL